MKVFRKQLVWIVLEHNPDEGLIFQHTDVISDAFILFGNVKENKKLTRKQFPSHECDGSCDSNCYNKLEANC